MFNKNKLLVGEKKYLAYSPKLDTFRGTLFGTAEEAFNAKNESSYRAQYKVLELHIVREVEGHLCFCKQHTCCCPTT